MTLEQLAGPDDRCAWPGFGQVSARLGRVFRAMMRKNSLDLMSMSTAKLKRPRRPQ